MFTIAGMRKFHSWTHASLSLVLDHLSTIPAADYTKEILASDSPPFALRLFTS